MEAKNNSALESHTIDFIPLDERHGHLYSVGAIWFGEIISVLAGGSGVVCGLTGIPFGYICIGILIGNIFGAFFMAGHSAQGPHLGVPQMIQSRAQFGFIGAVIPLAFVVIMYLGFFMSCASYDVQIAQLVVPSVPMGVGLIVFCAIAVIVIMYGYDLIHKLYTILSVLAVFIFGAMAINAFRMDFNPGTVFFDGNLSDYIPQFMLVICISAANQIGCAPYVADYSRYLPPDTKTIATFNWTFYPSIAGCLWCSLIGAYLVVSPIAADGSNVAYEFAQLMPGSFGPALFLIYCVVWMTVGMGLNLYGGFMSTTTIIQGLFPNINITIRKKAVICVCFAFVGALIAAWATDDFILRFEQFLQLLVFMLVPWTAINLIDFYVVRKGKYHVDEFFKPDGMYKRINWGTIIIYFGTGLVQVPFMSSSLYVGPISRLFDGADLSWIVGGIVAAAAYWIYGAIAYKNEDHEASYPDAV